MTVIGCAVPIEMLMTDTKRWLAEREAEAMNTFTAEMSDDAWALEFLHRHRGVQGEWITSLGRRWLTRVIWYFEERVENDLRGTKKGKR